MCALEARRPPPPSFELFSHRSCSLAPIIARKPFLYMYRMPVFLLLFLIFALLSCAAARKIPIPTPAPPCSIPLCSLNGPHFSCFPNFSTAASRQVRSQVPVTSCEMWAKATNPECPTICPLFCRIPQLLATNGQRFCNDCELQAASCRSDFAIVGPVCYLEFCAANGAKTICVDPKKQVATTCGAWGAGGGPDCSFLCPLLCQINGPCGSDGKRYCSPCQLRQVSCRSNFKIFGPVFGVCKNPEAR